MKKSCIFLCLPLFLAGCATQTTENYQQAVSSWQGADYNQVISVWGYPDQTKKAPSGNKLYIYTSKESGKTPIIETPPQTSVVTQNGKTTVSTAGGMKSGGSVYHLNCTTWFEVNKENKVVNTSERGNNCIADDAFVQSYSRGLAND